MINFLNYRDVLTNGQSKKVSKWGFVLFFVFAN